MGDAELRYIQEAFDTNWISPAGPHITAFEHALGTYTGLPHVAALSSGTAALHLALEILGVGAGDEVICQTFTFCGSANPIVYQRASPVFVDSEPDTWNMSPEYLRDAIEDRIRKGRKPAAIVYVHLYGMPAMVGEIMDVARRYDIPLIEDAAEALGARYKGQPVGGFGDMGFLSFNGNKIITTSGGGALLSRDGDRIAEARFLATQARDKAPHYEHSRIGYNYRLSNVCAAIGRGQLEVLEHRVRSRRNIYEKYRKALSQCAGVSFLREPEGHFSNRWLTCVVLPSGEVRDRLIQCYKAKGIEVRPLWKPMHLQPVYRDAVYYGGDLAERLFSQGLCLPSGSRLTDTEQDEIIQIFKGNI
jgi:dTDP-4-amino-4,6-dideoxygalactose transaminase